MEENTVKTENMTVKTVTISEIPKEETQNVTVKKETDLVNTEEVNDKTEGIEIDLPIKSEIILDKEELVDKTDSSLTEQIPEKMELQTMNTLSETKLERVIIPSKDIEPLTTAITPIAQKLVSEQLNSPLEGKENIPIIETGDTATKHSLEVIEVPYKNKQPDLRDAQSDLFRNSFIHEVKKRKLDILKEGGLEVTPVRSTPLNAPVKDNRPSVIHQASPPFPIISKPVRIESMPPPTFSAPSRRLSQSYNSPQVKISPSTPIKKPPASTNSFQFVNDLTPPKVVQSKSIYSYSEKTIYGNPKDILTSQSEPVVPKLISSIPRTGGDPVDLSVSSPQKPVVEIMRVPHIGLSSPYNRDTVTKNLYKSNNVNSIIGGRKLTPNLEITLVGPSKKSSPGMLKPASYTPVAQPSSTSQYRSHKRYYNEYYNPSKIAKSGENGKYKTSNVQSQKSNADINVPHPFKGSSGNQLKQSLPQTPPSMKPFSNPNLPAFPPYLPQLYDQATKGLTPYLPILDPAMYYSAAFQSLYSSGALNSSPLLHVPTPEQLKLYTELMAHGRLNFPFPLPPEGSPSSVLNSNNFKKP